MNFSQCGRLYITPKYIGGTNGCDFVILSLSDLGVPGDRIVPDYSPIIAQVNSGVDVDDFYVDGAFKYSDTQILVHFNTPYAKAFVISVYLIVG